MESGISYEFTTDKVAVKPKMEFTLGGKLYKKNGLLDYYKFETVPNLTDSRYLFDTDTGTLQQKLIDAGIRSLVDMDSICKLDGFYLTIYPRGQMTAVFIDDEVLDLNQYKSDVISEDNRREWEAIVQKYWENSNEKYLLDSNYPDGTTIPNILQNSLDMAYARWYAMADGMKRLESGKCDTVTVVRVDDMTCSVTVYRKDASIVLINRDKGEFEFEWNNLQ